MFSTRQCLDESHIFYRIRSKIGLEWKECEPYWPACILAVESHHEHFIDADHDSRLTIKHYISFLWPPWPCCSIQRQWRWEQGARRSSGLSSVSHLSSDYGPQNPLSHERRNMKYEKNIELIHHKSPEGLSKDVKVPDGLDMSYSPPYVWVDTFISHKIDISDRVLWEVQGLLWSSFSLR